MPILVLHGTLGSPEINWFPWLKAQLPNVWVPKLPTPVGQSVDGWWQAVRAQVPPEVLKDEGLILVGHSCGALFIPHLVKKLGHEIGGCVLVSAFTNKVGAEPYDTLNAPFFVTPELVEEIWDDANNTYILHGDNDPYVPLAEGEKLAEWWGVPLEVIKDGGHLNGDAGYKEFPRLVEIIKGLA